MRPPVTRAIGGIGCADLGFESTPGVDPVLHRFHPGHWTGPTAMTMRVEKVRVGFFQVFFAASAG
jgi:hypothetical protein